MVHPASCGLCRGRPLFPIAIGHRSDALKTPGGMGVGPPDAAVWEALNSKAKLAAGKACGLRTFEGLEAVPYQPLGHVPEPKPTHSFF